MKFSMRLSILSIVLTLLISVSASILIFGYIALNKVLVASASNTLKYASEKAAVQIDDYFKPLVENTSMASNLLRDKLLKPSGSDEFLKFLYYLIYDNPDISGAYFGDTKGNWYLINKEKNGAFLKRIVLAGKDSFKSKDLIVNSKGQIISETPIDAKQYNPTTRLWYQRAVTKNKFIFSLYKFVAVGSQEAQMGISSSFPVYDSNGALLGIFGIDIPIKKAFQYLEDIKITKNSNLFIVSDNGYELSSKDDREAIAQARDKARKRYGKASVAGNSDLRYLLKKESLNRRQKEHKNLFIFSFKGSEYISIYSPIINPSENRWSICIITPVSDINEELRKNILIWFIFMVIVILVGAILTSIFSSSLSRPIKKLAQDANLICQLRLDEVKQAISRIKEIAKMNESFTQMKNAISSFQRYMPIALVKKLIISGKVATVGGENKELTLMFTDIQNFTHISEDINPQALMEYLSKYFQVITKIVIDSSGTVDKYIGDGMMAFWGAPVDDVDHALHACLAALNIQEALQKLNQEYQKEGKPTVITRIGINTGNVIVGNVGSDDRLNYTSLGDHVNLTSRLEGINKIYGTSIIVSEYTYNKVKNEFRFRFLDRVLVKGKHKGVYIYELLDGVGLKLNIDLEEYNKDFSAAFMVYEKGDWQKALDLFYILNNRYSNDNVIKIFIERCLKFMKNQPDNMDGVWVVKE